MTLRSWVRRLFARPAARPVPMAPVRFSPLTIGFWLGGGLLGTGGCILGVCMPYHRPVAVVISALWWGIYLGCLGASLGALIAGLIGPSPAPASRGLDGRSRSARSLPEEVMALKGSGNDVRQHHLSPIVFEQTGVSESAKKIGAVFPLFSAEDMATESREPDQTCSARRIP